MQRSVFQFSNSIAIVKTTEKLSSTKLYAISFIQLSNTWAIGYDQRGSDNRGSTVLAYKIYCLLSSCWQDLLQQLLARSFAGGQNHTHTHTHTRTQKTTTICLQDSARCLIKQVTSLPYNHSAITEVANSVNVLQWVTNTVFCTPCKLLHCGLKPVEIVILGIANKNTVQLIEALVFSGTYCTETTITYGHRHSHLV